MSIDLLKHFNGNKVGEFKKLIDSFIEEPRIAWYPSAGEDFRALIYLNENYAIRNPASKKEPKGPDMFIFTDYFPWQNSRFLDNKLIYNDTRTTVEVDYLEELPSQYYRLNENLVHFTDGSTATNKVLFLKVKITSDVVGTITYPVLYAFMENTTFYCEKLKPFNAKITHVVHVRYGGGCGGGGSATGIWLLNILKDLHCELFITDNHLYWQDGDYFALKFCPKIPKITNCTLKPIRTLASSSWSGHGDVSWNLIE